jgi:hypothetical protein
MDKIMLIKMKKIILFFFFLNLFLFGLLSNNYAQKNDAAVWENIYLQKRVTSKFLIHLNHEGRITQNITQFHYGYADMGLTYKPNKNFHASLDYVFIEKIPNGKVLSIRHQFYLALTAKKKFKPFVFYYRQIIQSQVQDIYSSDYGRIPDNCLRSKITVKCELNRFTPYVASELYIRMNEPYAFEADRYRCFAGVFYELTKLNTIEFYYLVERFFKETKPDAINPVTNYVIGIGFAHTFY